MTKNDILEGMERIYTIEIHDNRKKARNEPNWGHRIHVTLDDLKKHGAEAMTYALEDLLQIHEFNFVEFDDESDAGRY